MTEILYNPGVKKLRFFSPRKLLTNDSREKPYIYSTHSIQIHTDLKLSFLGLSRVILKKVASVAANCCRCCNHFKKYSKTRTFFQRLECNLIEFCAAEFHDFSTFLLLLRLKQRYIHMFSVMKFGFCFTSSSSSTAIKILSDFC